jgi:hypothetical protein
MKWNLLQRRKTHPSCRYFFFHHPPKSNAASPCHPHFWGGGKRVIMRPIPFNSIQYIWHAPLSHGHVTWTPPGHTFVPSFSLLTPSTLGLFSIAMKCDRFTSLWCSYEFMVTFCLSPPAASGVYLFIYFHIFYFENLNFFCKN